MNQFYNLNFRLMGIEEYRNSRFKLVFFPIYWIFKIFKVSFSKQAEAFGIFLNKLKIDIGI